MFAGVFDSLWAGCSCDQAERDGVTATNEDELDVPVLVHQVGEELQWNYLPIRQAVELRMGRRLAEEEKAIVNKIIKTKWDLEYSHLLGGDDPPALQRGGPNENPQREPDHTEDTLCVEDRQNKPGELHPDELKKGVSQEINSALSSIL